MVCFSYCKLNLVELFILFQLKDGNIMKMKSTSSILKSFSPAAKEGVFKVFICLSILSLEEIFPRFLFSLILVTSGAYLISKKIPYVQALYLLCSFVLSSICSKLSAPIFLL